MGLTVGTFVLDTNIILYFLGGRLEDALPDGQYAVSVISELELLAYPGLTTPESERVKAFLADIAIVELTPLVKTHAVEIRKRFSLKLPDAIIAATAQAPDATLVTNDQRILALPELHTQSLRLSNRP